MASSDLNMLIDMGFDNEKASLAIKKSGNLQGAIDWLEKNQDKTVEEIKEEEKQESNVSISAADENALSLVCNECGKKFRSQAQAEFHASKTEHTDFSESTEEIAPLTEEEKAAKLADLREKLAAKRAGQSEQDKLDRKKNEEIRRKATTEGKDIKEELQRKEQIKEAQAKRREKQADIDARKAVLAKLEADKQERKRKAELEKAKRTGQALPAEPVAAAAPAAPAAPKPSSSYTEARLRLQVEGAKPIMKTYPIETTLFEVASDVEKEVLGGAEGGVNGFQMTFPKKSFDRSDFGMTIKEAGWVPSAALIVR
ncbi:hypothetical protein NA57DRAFT_74417 [Rhizodiscina lignyota]|uniref:C2H2-type domain-containing protein n=1 Tax=Rhizodiscina lignyota TaxID=1504668 RepID=A0A9P4IK65_9PEZI|nr:hypothetical protein NA57DRAFT_74417 [Rhizodiscina lignyota]